MPQNKRDKPGSSFSDDMALSGVRLFNSTRVWQKPILFSISFHYSTYFSSIFSISFHNFLLYFPNPFTIQLIFLPYFPVFSSYQKQTLTVMISPLCTNCHDVTVLLLNVASNTINLIFYLQRNIPTCTYLYIYIFMRIIDFIHFFASYFPILMRFKCPQ